MVAGIWARDKQPVPAKDERVVLTDVIRSLVPTKTSTIYRGRQQPMIRSLDNRDHNIRSRRREWAFLVLSRTIKPVST